MAEDCEQNPPEVPLVETFRNPLPLDEEDTAFERLCRPCILPADMSRIDARGRRSSPGDPRTPSPITGTLLMSSRGKWWFRNWCLRRDLDPAIPVQVNFGALMPAAGAPA